MRHFSERLDRLQGSIIREIFKMLVDPEIISLAGGSPAKESFPIDTVREIADALLREKGVAMMQYGLTTGYQPLREAYIEHIAKPKGVAAKLENTICFTGSGQGIYLIFDVFLDPGDVVLVENPTFLATLNVLRKMNTVLVPVEMDAEGIIIEDLEAKIKQYKPKMLYTIPSFQNPTGRTIPTDRRRKIAELAASHDFIVLEDDPYGEVRFRGEPVPAIKSFDTAGNVIMLNSFSKIIAPGLRVGACAAAPDIINKLELVKQGADTHTPTLTQAICAEFLSRGLLPEHLKSVANIYTERLDAMLDGIKRHFPAGCEYTEPEGGLFVWVKLPNQIDASALLPRVVAEAKVAYVPGAPFCVNPADGIDSLRLNYSSSDAGKIAVGVERLGKMLQAELK